MEHDSALAAVHSAVQSAATSQPANPAQPAATTQQPAAPQPAAPAASSASADQLATARAEGHRAGATAEKQRLSAIMKLDSAKDRQSQAMALALDTDVSAEQADAVLKASPANAKENSFDAAMRAAGNPALGTGTDKKADVKPPVDRAAIFNRYNNVGKAAS